MVIFFKVESLNNGDTTVALQQLDKAENSLDIAEDKLETMLVSINKLETKKLHQFHYFKLIIK